MVNKINPTDIFGKDYSEFSETDPFNSTNKVKGFICHKQTQYYGALIITHINDIEVDHQLIMATPKMHYPFGITDSGERKYNFPPAKSIEVYEKLDGTNILAYLYTNETEKFVSFKTRLRPFVTSSKFGNFYDMWLEVYESYRHTIERMIEFYNCNLSFELYGAKNPHLIFYKEPLTLALLFGITNTGKILTPIELSVDSFSQHPPEAPFIASMHRGDNFIDEYNSIRQTISTNLHKLDDNKLSGMEGAVWYLHTEEDLVIQFKCKPEEIEEIHWANSSLSLKLVMSACWKVLENYSELNEKNLLEILHEDYSDNEIAKAKNIISEAITTINEENEFKHQVLFEYKALNISIIDHKAEVMRTLSSKFQRNLMTKVYNIISSKNK